MRFLSRDTKIWLITLLMGCVLFVFVCPDLDLEPTALRAMRNAVWFFVMLIFPRILVMSASAPDFSPLWQQPERETSRPLAADLQSLTCTRLC